MAQAARNAATEQAEVAQRDRLRREAERAQEIERLKKEAKEKEMLEQRRKERQERERKLEQERQRQMAALPQTRNLYALKQERIKRGLDPDGRDDHLLPGNQSKTPYNDLMKKAAQNSRNTSSDAGPSSARNKSKDPFVSREDKAARRKRALFDDDGDAIGSMALAKASRDSTPSLVSRPSAPNSANGKASASARLVSNGAPKSTKSQGRANAASPGKALTAKDRLKAQFDPTRFVKLNTEKRDLRTIEEIEADMRRRRQQQQPHSLPEKREKQPGNQSRLPDNSQKKRARNDIDDDRPTKSSRIDNSMRDEIWRLLGRDRSRDIQRDMFSDDDDSDMEATGADVYREEQRAARIARQEDRNEEELLRRRAEEKAKRKNK
ncbi:hypothetical protein OIV83_003650 [Microbotryomycetes sp. JL201]|nr:hypothetical protein OIV83_003650 [Microbotryomycetes sp. JL201]